MRLLDWKMHMMHNLPRSTFLFANHKAAGWTGRTRSTAPQLASCVCVSCAPVPGGAPRGSSVGLEGDPAQQGDADCKALTDLPFLARLFPFTRRPYAALGYTQRQRKGDHSCARTFDAKTNTTHGLDK